jgi:hypothetical protein
VALSQGPPRLHVTHLIFDPDPAIAGPVNDRGCPQLESILGRQPA